ncbi:MAG: hypothetical protein BWK76_07085 [Desulfobulbaceae bacterium A2]|nr:MAG: hypothetical protein BWK76_07085 [Desulfobulbaceae bacterium A2]
MKHHLVNLGLLLLFNTAIALLLTLVGYGKGLWITLLFSHCIGGCVAAIHCLLIPRVPADWRRWLILCLSLPGSVLVGIGLAYLLLGTRPGANGGPTLWQSLTIGSLFAIIGCTVFLLAKRLHALDTELQQKRLEVAERERRELAAHLKLLQAQIEPHFLFNTLANVASLIELDPGQARRLLERLISWLRLALTRARSERASLGDELILLESWLQILSLRFGSRLSWSIDAPPATRQLGFPPMLLQPLVENAVRHGIEPKLGGGRLDITVRQRRDRLILEVRDNGVGLSSVAPHGAGTGLDNVRARLAALYGEQAGLTITSNAAGGVSATLEIPCAP